ncbi:MAG: hypothetical protein F9K48_06705 [Candidatus Brocadia sp.]|nr:MAG: hypothetical protein F9K48_06705 [Candidatus Brocadia sp.]
MEILQDYQGFTGKEFHLGLIMQTDTPLPPTITIRQYEAKPHQPDIQFQGIRAVVMHMPLPD